MGGRVRVRMTVFTVVLASLSALLVPLAVPAPASASPSPVEPFRSADAFVRQQFHDLQGRAATSSEVSSYASALTGGTRSAAATVDLVAHLGEGPVRSGNVTRLYTAYFQRLPDIGGLEYWIGKSAGGWTLNKISANFAGSSEFTRKYGSLTSAGFVDRAFQNVFGRAADPGGRAYWIGKLDKGMSRGSVMVGFSQSNEYQRKQLPTVDMVLASKGLLRRLPTGSEATDAIGRVASGGLAALAGDLLALPAYAARFPVPGAPPGFDARVGDAKATLTWKAPATNGVAIVGYTLRVFQGGVQQGADRALAASARSTVVSGLTNGQAYTFSLFASNANRDGAAAAVGPVTVRAEAVWATFQGNAAHTGVQPVGTVPATPTLKWKKKFPGMVRQVAVGDGRIYALVDAVPVGSTSVEFSLVALDPANGAVLWGPMQLADDIGIAAMTYDEGRIFIAIGETIRAYDAATGSPLWAAKPGGWVPDDLGPAVGGGQVYAWGETTFVALDAATGVVRWKVADLVAQSPVPAIDATGVYLASGCTYRYTPAGVQTWKSAGPCVGSDGWVTLASGRVWVTQVSDEDAAILDAATGARVGTPPVTKAPAVTGGTALYNVDVDGDQVLRAVDWATGTVKWTKPGDGYLQNSPVVNAGRAYIGSWLGKVYGFDVATGASTWTRDVRVDVTPPGEEPDGATWTIRDLALGDGLLLVPMSDEDFDEGGWILAYG